MADRRQEEELATFLRSRRQRLRPQDVGLPAAGRRRTPGLRREEVAVLAGLSTTWYTYLEQGRGREVSPAVLDSIARVLQLTEDERRYVHLLAFGHVVAARPLGEEVQVSDLLREIVAIAGNQSNPLYACNRAGDLIAWNEAAVDWYDDWSRLPERDQNFMTWLLTEDKARSCLVDWEMVVRDLIARGRADVALQPGDRVLQNRIAELKRRSPDFQRLWNDHHEVRTHRTGVRRMRHPDKGISEWRLVPLVSIYQDSPTAIFHLPV
ncbi:MAG TPA: helix-turn-helix transcriptional regulator [Streptosporangiaceae bacterium]|nr:helix-turn-helix transcriptional regulator [Streptosporangiaceae bacterium]